MKGLQLKYFVLNPYKDTAYGRASRIAILSYARSIRRENKKLANDLEDWITLMEIEMGLADGKH